MVNHNRSERLCDCCGSIGLTWLPEQIKELRRRIRESEDSASCVLRIDSPAGRASDLIDVVAKDDATPTPTTLSEGMGSPVDPEVSSGLPHTLPLIKPRTV